MASLLNTASSWNNADIPPKKRIPSMKKMFQQKTADTKDKIEGFSSSFGGASIDMSPLSSNIPTKSILGETAQKQTANKQLVHSIIDKMTTLGENNAGGGLSDYKPFDDTDPLSHSQPHPQPIYGDAANHESANPTNSSIQTNSNLGGFYTNYSNAYNQRIATPTKVETGNAPYYASFGIGGGAASTGGGEISNVKMMERINYMIHLLEEQQMEKTNYVMEEFIMYTFLGVFMIYVCDSFSCAGKYVR